MTEAGRWARAMSVGILTAFPITRLPGIQTLVQLTCQMWLIATVGVPELLLGRANSLSLARRSLNSNRHLIDPAAERLYIYSVSDKICPWEEIESHAAEAEERGSAVRRVKFDESSHVAHVKRYPREHWQAVTEA